MADVPSPSSAVPSSSESSQRIRPIHESNSESTLRIPPHAATPTSQSQSQSAQKTLALNSGLLNSDRGGEESKESSAIGVAGSGNGKRKVIRKTVRLVKKVIKRRVPKRVLRSCSENQGVAEDGVNLSEVRDNLDLVNGVIEKSNVVDDVVDKTSVANEANNVFSVVDDVIESSNLVNEKSDNVDRVTEKTSIIDEVMEKENIMQELEIGNAANASESIIGKKSKDPTGIAYMELDKSKLTSGANSSEETVPVNDLSGISTMETDNVESNDVVSEVDGNDPIIRAPDLLDVEKVNNVSTKEILNSKTDNQSEDFIVETEKIDVANMVDGELLSGQNVSPVREKGEKTISKDENGSEMDSDRIRLTDGLLLNEEVEALERTKRHKTEIFVGGLDRDAQEDDIRKVFGEAGLIVEIRLVMSNSGKNRGYAFVRFATAANARNALENYSKVKICGKQCNIAPVEGNDTIFLGNIDRTWKTEDVVTFLEKGGIDKIDKVTLKADPDNNEKNRGFAFVEFETCKDAQTAFNKLQKKDVFGKQLVKAAWARPLSEPSKEEILQVKSVYVEHLPSSWDKEKVKDYFKRFGEIESVSLAKDLASSRRKDFAFIYYTTRDAALTCIEAVNRERLEDGRSKVKMAVSLANPVSKRKQMNHTSDLSSKQHFEAKRKTFETSKRQHEPRNQGKDARSSYNNHVKVDKRSSTTDELVQILRQQASNKHILSHPRTGIDIPDHHFPLPGRTFSLSGHDPIYTERQDYSRLRIESSHLVSGPSSSSHGVGMLSFPYHHRQVPGFTSESVNERRTYPSLFQKREEAPYYADNSMHRRCE